MHKEYRINIWRAGYILAPILGTFLSGIGVYGLYCTIRSNASFLLVSIGIGATLAVLFFLVLFLFYFNKLRIRVDDENVTYRMPDKNVKFNVKDIYKIERDFSGAGVGYYVFFYDDKRKKRHIKFTQDLEESEQLVNYLERKSGVKMRQEGTLDVENEKRPIIKVLKIVYNIIITLAIFGLLVAWPFVHTWSQK